MVQNRGFQNSSRYMYIYWVYPKHPGPSDFHGSVAGLFISKTVICLFIDRYSIGTNPRYICNPIDPKPTYQSHGVSGNGMKESAECKAFQQIQVDLPSLQPMPSTSMTISGYPFGAPLKKSQLVTCWRGIVARTSCQGNCSALVPWLGLLRKLSG